MWEKSVWCLHDSFVFHKDTKWLGSVTSTHYSFSELVHTVSPWNIPCRCFWISRYQVENSCNKPRNCVALYLLCTLCLCVGDPCSPTWFQVLAWPEHTPRYPLSLCWRTCCRYRNLTHLRSWNLGSIFLIAKYFLYSFHPGQISPYVSWLQKWDLALLS